jgi:hypothetical protein
LEPDRRYGRAFLEATQAVKQGQRRHADFPHTGLPPASMEVRGFWRELGQLLRYHLLLRIGNLKLAINRRPWLRNLLLPLVRLGRRLRALLGAS